MKSLTIIGGGLAGVTLGIGLRQRDVPVTIWEAGRYPRRRVCGEFVSGRGQQVLERLGLLDLFQKAGAIQAGMAAFFLGNSSSAPRAVSPPALCLSRLTMDALLAGHFQSGCQGLLRQNARWTGNTSQEGLVWAAGRRAQPIENGWRWFGLKAHARNVRLLADLEMHGQDHSYVGLCRLPGGETNVCGLFRRAAGSDGPSPSWQDALRGPPGSLLHERMAGALFDEGSFCSVAGLPLRPARATGRPECRIGDALTMIPPVTGNGMSMAFEAAGLAIEPLCAYSRAELSWSEARQALARACDNAFAKRLAWAKVLQWLMFCPVFKGRLGRAALNSDCLWRFLFSRTR
ncbi:MAG TPA: FAD-dependent monooxygenase [Verrucomicrobiae bacterium]|nr:FAD-dependent monooxygenase [Verrucomicrobiae bacterium]